MALVFGGGLVKLLSSIGFHNPRRYGGGRKFGKALRGDIVDVYLGPPAPAAIRLR
jgi:hypothetical protein